VSDQDTSTPVELEIKVNKVSDPLNQIQLSKNVFQPIRVSKNSFVHHLLSYSDVKLGNELEFEV